MSLVPEDKLITHPRINLAPMIDFLFLMLAFFATLAVTRTSLFDTNLDLVKLQTESSSNQVYRKDDLFQVNLSITKNGHYNWITEIDQYPMQNLETIQKELGYQYDVGILPVEKEKTKVLIHIDKEAPWESIAKLIFSVREMGFDANPIYEPKPQEICEN